MRRRRDWVGATSTLTLCGRDEEDEENEEFGSRNGAGLRVQCIARILRVFTQSRTA